MDKKGDQNDVVSPIQGEIINTNTAGMNFLQASALQERHKNSIHYLLLINIML